MPEREVKQAPCRDNLLQTAAGTDNIVLQQGEGAEVLAHIAGTSVVV